MRKHQQKQILGILNAIEEAQSAGLYADCQDGAVSVGGYIENIMGEGTQTVKLLEEYCELLFKAHNGEIGEKPLRKHLIKIENSVKNELKPNRIEVVFLSYKASMSDSLESIYFAAKSDSNCDAYWMPIPYYERNPDRSFGAMHCEGAEYYGGNFECIDWQKYDIEARRPDIIFTFNPYDGNNFVTSVHPDFYCERLREFTDLLVYVPYFVSADNVQKHFCIAAGCVFAHKVIVQSDKIRDNYIQHFKETYDNKFGRPEDRFAALGSPKFDKVINTRREDFELPQGWCELIGTRKIVLFNTSLSSLLEGEEQYLKKLRYVLDIFRNRGDIALWWRPHPLGESTYRSMRPQLLSAYESIMADYKREGWGIYDDTADLHRAIVYSDAYYGDKSSVLLLYQVTGKPMMLQKYDCLSEKKSFTPRIHHVDETDIWFSFVGVNALYKMSRDAWQPQFVDYFPGEHSLSLSNGFTLYYNAAINNDKIYFSPFSAKEIAVYSKGSHSFLKLDYRKTERPKNHQYAFYNAVECGGNIYFTPHCHTAVVRLNTVTNSIDYCSDWLEPLRKLMTNTRAPYFSNSIVVGNSIWLAAYDANAVVRFNTETNKSTIYETGRKDGGYNGICFDGENFWLTPKYNTVNAVIKWHPDKGVLKEFAEIYAGDSGKHGFRPMVFGGGFVWLLPAWSRHAYKIDTKLDAISIAEEFECDASGSAVTCVKYYQVQTFGENIFAYNEVSETLIAYNFASKERKEQALRLSPEVLAQMHSWQAGAFIVESEQMQSVFDCRYYESDVAKLPRFVDFVMEKTAEEQAAKRREIIRKNNVNADGKAGEAIFDFVRKQIFR
ncbi:MAG: hypothetical protein FWE32_02355 [Oscillospiraceae bacterium]|nr:hypothetical protein [Oscillospiraceae bacterium]